MSTVKFIMFFGIIGGILGCMPAEEDCPNTLVNTIWAVDNALGAGLDAAKSWFKPNDMTTENDNIIVSYFTARAEQDDVTAVPRPPTLKEYTILQFSVVIISGVTIMGLLLVIIVTFLIFKNIKDDIATLEQNVIYMENGLIAMDATLKRIDSDLSELRISCIQNDMGDLP